MPKRINIIPKAPLARIILNAGGKRVSADSLDVFVDVLTDYIEGIASKAVMIAKHTGRKTVKAEDVKLAAK
jgi:histone H3/H4